MSLPADQAMPQTFNIGARSLFVSATAWGFIVLAALASVSALLQRAELASFLPGLTVVGNIQPLPLLVAEVFGGFVTAARVMAVLATLAACTLLGWISRRLMSKAVRQEFA